MCTIVFESPEYNDANFRDSRENFFRKTDLFGLQLCGSHSTECVLRITVLNSISIYFTAENYIVFVVINIRWNSNCALMLEAEHSGVFMSLKFHKDV